MATGDSRTKPQPRLNYAEIMAQARAGSDELPVAQAAPKPAPATTIVRLPVWPEATRACPNTVLRSALFGIVERGARRYMEVERIAAQAGIEIFYTGRQLDQADLDVYLAVLYLCRDQVMGAECRFAAHGLLRALGKTNTGKNYKVLDVQLARLNATAIRIKAGRYSYEGSLIDKVYRDHATKRYVVVLNSDLRALFAPDQFTQLDWAVRHELAGKPLAQWLHGFYASHAEPFPISAEKLRELSGSEIKRPRAFKEKLKKALDALTEALAAHGQPFRWSFDGDLVCVERTATRAQRKHLAKPRKPRR